jgi:hypothetical protein
VTIRWDIIPGARSRTVYYVDDVAVGEDDGGFDRVLDMVRSHGPGQVTLKIREISSLGGDSLTNALPFRAKADELTAAAGENRIVYEFY